MKKITLILSIIFTTLTFVGVGYVLLNDGHVNAGCVVVPMVFALAFMGIYRNLKMK